MQTGDAPTASARRKDRRFQIVALSGTPAFATGRGNIIVAFNTAAEEWLGHTQAEVLGRRCDQVLCGSDSFGNPYCMRGCAIAATARKGIPIFPFELALKSASGPIVTAEISILFLDGGPPEGPYLMHLLRPVRPSSAAHLEGAAGLLTRRETEILRFISTGRAVKEVAGSLGISVATARVHVRNAIRKLGAHSQIEAVARAFRSQII